MRCLSVTLLSALVLMSACSFGNKEASTPSIPPEGTIRGVVSNVDGYSLKGLMVLAVSSDGKASRTGYTDAKGIYLIEELGLGGYTLHVSRGLDVVAERHVEVRNAAAQTKHFIVPTQFGDRPEDRARPIVPRSLVTTSR